MHHMDVSKAETQFDGAMRKEDTALSYIWTLAHLFDRC